MKMDALQEVVVAISEHRSVDATLLQITEYVSQCLRMDNEDQGPLTTDDALVRIWLIEPGDKCARCNMRSECPDQRECLHLVASAGTLRNPNEDWRRLDVLAESAQGWSRSPLGVTNIGMIAKTGVSIATDMMEPGPGHDGLPDWGPAEGVVSFTGRALQFRGQVLGVLAVFSRQKLPDDVNDWLRIFANHAAVAIGNARAFEEIEFLKERLEEEVSYLSEEVSDVRGSGDLVGESPALRKVQQQIELVAPTEATVLITGESGTGKELVARAIHERSPRRERPMITVNCGAIPEALFESEFFGHARGAFTGALRDKPGRFELADGGTLFLDEIGEVPAADAGEAAARAAGAGSRARRRNAARARSTCASSPRPIATSKPRSKPDVSARISSTGSASSRSKTRRCASAAKTSRAWPSISSASPRNA